MKFWKWLHEPMQPLDCLWVVCGLLLVAWFASCAATVEDVGRFLFPNRVVVQRAFGDIDGHGAGGHEREDWVVGLEWDLMPTQVRIIEDDLPRSWYEPEIMVLEADDPDEFDFEKDEGGGLWFHLPKWWWTTVLIPILVGGEVIRRRRRRNNGQEPKE